MKKVRNIIGSYKVLSLFDPNQTIERQCVASKDAIDCCLLQNKKYFYFAYIYMNNTEVEYAQEEKELLAVTFSNKFHDYIYGHKDVAIYSDHMPLTSIVKKPLHKIQTI